MLGERVTGTRGRSATGQREDARREQHDQRAAEHDAVDHERQERALRDVAHEERDDGEPDDESDDGRRERLERAVDLGVQFVAPRRHGSRSTCRSRRSRCRTRRGSRAGTRSARRPAACSRGRGPSSIVRARAGDAGDEGEHLREAEEDAVRVGEVVELAVLARRASRRAEQDAEDDEHDRDEPQRAERRPDLVLESSRATHDRDRADDDEPAHPDVGVVRAATLRDERTCGTTAPMMRAMSRQKKMTHGELGADLRDRGEASRPGRSRSAGTRRRCAGARSRRSGRNSVRPWTRPRMIASRKSIDLHVVLRGVSSSASRSVSTRLPKTSASSGTRSSTPWNIAGKSRSAGSCSGAKP